MEKRENLFNKTSLKLEKRIKRYYEDAFNIITELDPKEAWSKESNLLSKLIEYDNDMLFGIIKERIYEFCKDNKDNVMTYDDNGISIKSKNDTDGIPVTDVFVNLYKYFEYVEHANQIIKVYFKDDKFTLNDIKIIFAPRMAQDFEYLSTNQMDTVISNLSKYTFESTPTFSYDYELVYATDTRIQSYTDPQQFILHTYLETMCHVFNNIRRNPEIFIDELGINLQDLYSDKFIYTAFILRDRIITNHYDVIKNFSRTYRNFNSLPFEV